MTKTEVDRLGERLRRGPISDADLRLLDAYRRSFAEAYEFVISALRERTGMRPTGRPAKSTTSIVEKLRRESIRLTQMQDIAGCRQIVSDVTAEDRAVRRVANLFDDAVIVDRRERPSHGYRAVHVVVKRDGKPIEIQLRTRLQHLWAELSEKLSDVADPAVKYGGGPEQIRSILARSSHLVAQHETESAKLARLAAETSRLAHVPARVRHDILELQRELRSSRTALARVFRESIASLARL